MRRPGLFAVLLAVSLLHPTITSAATTELVTVAFGGGPADGETLNATMTSDGRWIAFASNATNLVASDINVLCDANNDTILENCPDVFVRDRDTSTTTVVSVDSFGVQANRRSDNPDISTDGRWVVFESVASNLVAGDTNGQLDCFLHDRDTGSTERVSITDAEGQAYGRSCRVSDDGRFIAFVSGSDALTSNDDSYEDVFIRDRQAGTTTWISFWAAFFGDNECDSGNNIAPSISGDGRFVMFTHDDGFECNEDDGEKHIIIHDRENVSWDRLDLNPIRIFNAGPLDFGRFFTYRMYANPIDPLRVYLRDRELNKTEEISVSSSGAHGDGNAFGGRVTSDGRFVAFSSTASDLVPGDTNVCDFESCDDVFLRDREAGTTERVSLTATGGEGNGNSLAFAIADDATAVLFRSDATNLVAGDTNALTDFFVRASVCGDTTIDRGEECDDGNLASGDGCSATCLFDCPAVPSVGCLAPLRPGKSTLKLADRTPSTKDQLQWNWQAGPATPKAAFGQPTAADGYRLCVYDANGLALTVGIPSGVGWKETPTGFKYKRKSASPDGVVSVQLKEGLVAEKAKIQVKGKGDALPIPALAALVPPLTVQLSNALPVPSCWSAVYSAPLQRQDAAQLKDKSD